MATSGTVAFNLDLAESLEEAYERAGLEMRSGYDLRTARRSLNLLFAEWSNMGVNLWALDSSTISLTASTATYNLPTDTVDLLDVVLRTDAGEVSSQSDLMMNRVSATSYAQIPNKLSTGRPLQYWVRRLIVTPTITVWPVPSEAYTLVYWRLRRMEDTGTTVANTLDVPYRFLPAMVSGLAYLIAMKKPGMEQRAVALKAVYDEAMALAMAEDRERASVRWVPWSGVYG